MINNRTIQYWIDIVLKSTELIQDNQSLSYKIKNLKRDVVTNVDLLIENFILSRLGKYNIPFISEETNSNKKFNPKKKYLILDPIDGTVNFINNLPNFSISLGYFSKNKFLHGIVCAPKLKEIFFTTAKKISFLNGDKLKIEKKKLENSLVAISLPSKNYEKNNKIFYNLNKKSMGCIRQGSASLNICWVASGKFQIACGFNAKIWDIAGAIPIAKYAGCKIILTPNKNNLHYDYIVAHPEVIQEVKKIINEK